MACRSPGRYDRANVRESRSCTNKGTRPQVPRPQELAALSHPKTKPVPPATAQILGLPTQDLTPFFAGRPLAQALKRLETLAAWMAGINTQNHDGVTLTPALVSHLSSGDIQARIADLDQRRRATSLGQFDPDDLLQRELEYRRYASEAKRQPTWPQDEDGRRCAFDALETLPPQQEEDCILTDQDRLEAQRTAWEARGLLDFLRHFRAHTQRSIVVVGNERYGRHFVVEPLEPHLAGDFAVRYERTPSHLSMRLTVPHYTERFQRNGFAPEFMRHLSAHMPHVVLVDVCSPRGTERYTKVPRGIRDLVNWFMVFNHLRAQGDRRQYQDQSGLPPHLLDELEKWYEFVVVRRRIGPWIEPGPTYAISHWAPELKEEVLMGDLAVPRRPATPGDEPQVILANPALYRTEGADLPEFLRRTQPYYFNDPEKRIREEIVPGFGTHGFETRVRGCTTDQYVAAVQRAIGQALQRCESS